jgi:TonB family protein
MPQPVMQREPEPVVEEILELPSHSRLPRLDLGVDWESPWAEFRSSWHDFFRGPKAPDDDTLPADADLRVDWIEGKLGKRGYVLSAMWHILAVILICLPIWHFLDKMDAKSFDQPLPVVTWDTPAADLPPIALKGPDPKPSPKGDPAKPLAQKGADAFHPRQTILAEPVKITHPRQTLIQPDAPPAPPKVDAPLPNVVEMPGAATQQPPALKMQTSVSQAKIKRREITDVAAPEVANDANHAGPLNIAPTDTKVAAPKLPMSAMTAVQRKQVQAEAGAAPDVSAASGNEGLHSVIALSSNPGPPAPVVNVPQGNLASKVAISPDGKQPGAPGGAEHGAATNGGSGGNSASNGGAGKTGGGNASSLPGPVSITGGNSHSNVGGNGNGGLAHPSTKLNLKPTPDSAPSAHGYAPTIGAIDPRLPPETVLSSKDVYTLHIDMPNLTSFSGSWIVKFAELRSPTDPPYYHPTGQLSGPEPITKADPKYPQSLIKERVDGEVVLYAVIRKDGTVDSIQVIRSLDPALDKNSADALARWVFKPASREGKPVDCEAVIHIPFRFRPD